VVGPTHGTNRSDNWAAATSALWHASCHLRPHDGRAWPAASCGLGKIRERKEVRVVAGILWALFVVLVIFWLLGLAANVGGSLIHLLLVIALVVLLWNLLVGRRTV
jgi:hypothetical protein